jgi:outer membrane biosynthesis protein TonB
MRFLLVVLLALLLATSLVSGQEGAAEAAADLNGEGPKSATGEIEEAQAVEVVQEAVVAEKSDKDKAAIDIENIRAAQELRAAERAAARQARKERELAEVEALMKEKSKNAPASTTAAEEKKEKAAAPVPPKVTEEEQKEEPKKVAEEAPKAQQQEAVAGAGTGATNQANKVVRANPIASVIKSIRALFSKLFAMIFRR